MEYNLTMRNINFNKVIEPILFNNAIKATEYRSPKLIVRATRKLFGKKIIKNHNFEIVVTVGRPNYVEREFVKMCVKSGEPFPVKKVQVKLYNPKKKKLSPRK